MSRPRQYASGAERTAAHRARQKEAAETAARLQHEENARQEKAYRDLPFIAEEFFYRSNGRDSATWVELADWLREQGKSEAAPCS